MPLPAYDFEPKAGDEIARIRALLDEMDAKRTKRPAPDHAFQPQQQGFIHTPEGGAVAVALIQQHYPRARLVGSLSHGRASRKDIDVLIPLFFKADKLRCVQVLTDLFNPNHLAQCRGFDGFGLVANPHGVLDIFFNNRHI